VAEAAWGHDERSFVLLNNDRLKGIVLIFELMLRIVLPVIVISRIANPVSR
jgi:hypothetical protein